jgi:hypothetical protein
VSKETISRIAAKVVAEMTEWSSRPLDRVYVAVFIDAIVVKVTLIRLSAFTALRRELRDSPSWVAGSAALAADPGVAEA